MVLERVLTLEHTSEVMLVHTSIYRRLEGIFIYLTVVLHRDEAKYQCIALHLKHALPQACKIELSIAHPVNITVPQGRAICIGVL